MNPKTISKLPVKFITWLSAMIFVLILAHITNDNPQTIGKWIPPAKKLLNLDAPLDNWYGPTAAILMMPFSFMSSNYLFLVTLFYFVLGSFFYYQLVEGFLVNRILNYIGLIIPFLNPYLIRLIDSSPDTVFEFFLLTLLMWAVVKNKHILFVVAGIGLSELRSGYWILTLLLALIIPIRCRTKRSAISLMVFPSLLTILIINFFLYGIFAPASEGARTAYFSNNKYAYLLESTYQIDHFFDGDNGPMRTNCQNDLACKENLLIDVRNNKQETIFSLLNKFDTYFFSVQKVPRLPGWFELDTKRSVIKIGESNLSWSSTAASILYFIYKSIWLISTVICIFLLIFNFSTKERKNIKLKLLALPWVIGSIPAVLFFAETRVWIVSELLLVPFLLETFQQYANKNKAGR
jgi:hypothetical protein